MRSGLRLEIAIRQAEREAVDAPGIPKTALNAPESAFGLDPEEGARLAVEYSRSQREHTAGRDWSYLAEVEERIDQHLQRRRAGRTC